MRDPVCPLILALYGHPDSGGYWEHHCEKHLRSVGFVPIADWRSCFWHSELGLYLVVYVDDFKMAGPSGNLAKGWSLIRKGVSTELPTPTGKYLGCDHLVSSHPVTHCNPVVKELLELPEAESTPGPAPLSRGGTDAVSGKQSAKVTFAGSQKSAPTSVRTLEWDMSGFLRQCVELYQELGGRSAANLRKVDTPFLEVSFDQFEALSSQPDFEKKRVNYRNPLVGY